MDNIALLREEINELNVEINRLSGMIKERASQFNKEREERENDPMWRVAATDYIQNGDRSGLENYHNNKLMAEQTLVDRINGFDTDELNLNKDLRTVEAQIEATRKSIKATQDNSERMALEARLKELTYSKKQIEGLIEMNGAKKNSAIEMYNKRYGKKAPYIVSNKNTNKTQSDEDVDDNSDDSMITKINDLKDEASDFKLDNIGSKSYTQEEYEAKKRELLDECKKLGIKGKDREEIIASLGDKPTNTKLNNYKVQNNWNGIYSELKNTPTRSKSDIDSKLKKIVDSYDEPYGRDELLNAMLELYPQTQQGKLEQNLADDNNSQVVEWNKNKSKWSNDVRVVSNSKDRSDNAQKKHQEAYDQLNEYGKREMEKLGYHWDGRFWNVVKKGNSTTNGRPKGFGG